MTVAASFMKFNMPATLAVLFQSVGLLNRAPPPLNQVSVGCIHPWRFTFLLLVSWRKRPETCSLGVVLPTYAWALIVSVIAAARMASGRNSLFLLFIVLVVCSGCFFARQ